MTQEPSSFSEKTSTQVIVTEQMTEIVRGETIDREESERFSVMMTKGFPLSDLDLVTPSVTQKVPFWVS